ncbi:STAS domain-containing protein [Paractinoplanes rishiriensis]|uniref:STAS domain-containing protein n=1 Tax=Paractinoplanes rishiriensis TaxID=1050105 RepID=A0A919K6I6_9ACTN|nr:STAS domain-containing protein [Actinoplanes rishiriensis]GIF01836.1 hypothetical protein Ari01nite_93000 [Actinoplanes rishiriensis]
MDAVDAPASGQRIAAGHTARATPVLAATASPGDAAVTSVRITTDVDRCGVAIIAVAGELVMDTADDLTAALTAYRVTRVVVDLDRMPFLDMAALTALLRGRDAALRADASFGVIRAQGLVRQVLHLTGMCPALTPAPAAGARRAAPRAVDGPGQRERG